MLPSRCSQLPCTKSAVSGVSRACVEPFHRSLGITPQRSKYPAWADSRASALPYTGLSPESGLIAKTTQHRAMRA